MRYVNHYEIEVTIDRRWTFIGNLFPKYEWKIVRPWYFLGLVPRPRLVDPINPALIARLDAIAAAGEFAYAVKPHTPARIWRVERRGRWLVKSLTWETPT